MPLTNIIVLAAGRGKRMKSDLPKVLVPFMKKPMIRHVLENTESFNTKKVVVVVGYKKELVMKELSDFDLTFVTQEEQLGTGHAVLSAEKEFDGDFDSNILVLFGDSPLLSKKVIQDFVKFHEESGYVASMLTKDSETPGSCARIIRNFDNSFRKSVEYKDLTGEYFNIKEINVGVIICNSKVLFETLKKVNNNNSQKEYYLPDVINILSKDKIGVFKSNDIPDLFSFNTYEELQKAESMLT